MPPPHPTPTHPKRGRDQDGCFVLVLFLQSCGCLCFVPIPCNAMDWFVFCDSKLNIVIDQIWGRVHVGTFKVGDVLTWRRLNFDLTG